MSALLDSAARARAQMLARDARTTEDIRRAYNTVLRRLHLDLEKLTRRIEQAQRAGEPVGTSWLFQQDRYQELIRGLEMEIHRFLPVVDLYTTRAQEQAVQAAAREGQRMVVQALGPAPAGGAQRVAAGFARFDPESLAQLVGVATNGQPLRRLLEEIAPHAVSTVRDALAFGVAQGRNPMVTAREVQQLAGVPLTRARTIARTETLRAWREGSDRVYQASGVVQGWVWWSALDHRTCPSCWAQHGQEFELGRPMESHPNCRCAKLPRTVSWADIGFPHVVDRRPAITPGPVVFARQSGSVQRAVLGPQKYAAYRDGTISLEAMVTPTMSARWGAGTRSASLREAVSRS